ncbi:hypothetical protein L3X38_041176 [Prunus dulcis]|uniref:TIR domain-containing protein n=1 Tax=Prunus dulcis TaxID=3755 RepID=A0AAD4USR2_PRUDU|nr:hypothetical protein L3X38_041176 [Prunus dulcis]
MGLSTQRASASLTSAELAPPRWKHDDDRGLEKGASISPELLTTIKQSHLAIIVLSPTYASSTWCLDELSKILEYMEDTNRILPIFYGVHPSDVRNQWGSFAEAFTKHEEKFSEDIDKVNRWRAALRKVGGLSGLDSKNSKSERELIEDIVNVRGPK